MEPATLPLPPRRAVPSPATTARPVRVCFLIDELSRAGTETQLLALIRRLDRRRVQPHLCLLRGDNPRSRALEPDCCPVLRLDVKKLCAPTALAHALRLGRFLRRQRINVLQVYFRDSTYFGVLVGRLAGVPCIVRTWNNLGYALTALDRRLGRLCNRLTDFTLANCGACRDAALVDEGRPRNSVLVLENGVDLARFAGVTTIRTFQGPPRVGVMANLRPVKGLDVFVRAAADVARTHPGVAFTVGGEGALRPHLEHLARDLGLAPRLELPGAIQNVPAFLDRLDVAVLSSRSEGLSNAVLEYMAAGRPIVATAVGGTPELIEDGVHGLLVPPGDAAALAGAIRRLLDDPTLAARLAAAARRRARQRYSRERMVERFAAFYEGCARADKQRAAGLVPAGRTAGTSPAAHAG